LIKGGGILAEESVSTTNVQSEIMFLGSLLKSPDLYITYGNFIRSKYDFSDAAVKFFYDCFETYYVTFSQTVDETKMNVFMSQNQERLETYKKYKGWKTLQQYMNLADETDCKNYYELVKKYSLLREYERNGYPISKILSNKNFDKMTAGDIYRIIRVKADKIHTIINAGEEAVELTKNTTSHVKKYLSIPDMGLAMPWPILNEMFRGCRLGKVVFNGFLSNAGKSRNLMLLAAYITLVLNEKFLLLSNEMDEEDLENCLITTVLNNKFFQDLHGVHMQKPEREIVLGVYHDKNGNILRRKVDDEGQWAESEEEYELRLLSESEDYNNVLKVTEWIDRNKDGKLMFKDVSNDYSDTVLEFEFRKAKMIYDIKYCAYDTLKGFRTDDWSTIKQTATKIKELMGELKMFCWSVFQLTDETVFTDIFSLSSNNIANAKQIKHIADHLMLGKALRREEYHKYQYISMDEWGEPSPNDLELSKEYFGLVIDKNRGGNKKFIPLMEINLDYNIWNEVGYLIKKTAVT
jgi:replicative DNA helicase